MSGIGPKGALAILASGQTGQVVQAIEHEDESFSEVPGRREENSAPNDFRFKGKLADVVPDAFVDYSQIQNVLMRRKVLQLSLMRRWKLCAHLDTRNESFSRCTRVIKRIINDGSVY